MSQRKTHEYIRDYAERLLTIAEHWEHEEHTSRYLSAMGNSSEVDRGVTGTRQPDASLFAHVRHPDQLAEQYRRAAEAMERGLRRLYERMADRDPVRETDQRQAS